MRLQFERLVAFWSAKTRPGTQTRLKVSQRFETRGEGLERVTLVSESNQPNIVEGKSLRLGVNQQKYVKMFKNVLWLKLCALLRRLSREGRQHVPFETPKNAFSRVSSGRRYAN